MITESGCSHVRIPFIAGNCGYIANYDDDDDDDDDDNRDKDYYHCHRCR